MTMAHGPLSNRLGGLPDAITNGLLIRSSRSHNMVFTQGPLSLGKSHGHERRNASVAFFSDGDGGTPSIFVQAPNTWYNLCDTYIVRFVAGGCRKNLPLRDLVIRD